MSSIKLRPGDDKHALDVELTGSEIRKLGDFSAVSRSDEALARLLEQGILSKTQFDELTERVNRAKGSLSTRKYQARKSGNVDGAAEIDSEFWRLSRAGATLRRLLEEADPETRKAERRPGIGLSLNIVSGGKVVRSFDSVPMVNLRVEFDEAWPQMEADWRSTGVNPEEIERRRKACDEEIERYMRVQELYEKGHMLGDIVERTGVNRRTVVNWTGDGKIPVVVARTRDRYFRVAPESIPAEYSTQFAYVLGAYVANITTAKPRMELKSKDEDAIRHFQRCIKAAFGDVTCNITDENLPSGLTEYGCSFSSVKALAYMHDITCGGTQVPWEHLLSEGERKAFFQAFLDHESHLSVSRSADGQDRILSKVFRISVHGGIGLAQDLMVLAGIFGVLPTGPMATEDGHRLNVCDSSDIRRVCDIGFHSRRKQEAVESVLENFKTDEGDETIERYFQAFRLFEDHKPVAEIARSCGVSPTTVNDWLTMKRKPNRLKRKEAIEEMARFMPDPDVIGFVFRGFHGPSIMARRIAQARSLEEVVGNSQTLMRLHLEPSENLSLLALSPESVEREVRRGEAMDLARRLEAESEVRIDRRVDEESYFRQMNRYRLLSTEEELVLLQHARTRRLTLGDSTSPKEVDDGLRAAGVEVSGSIRDVGRDADNPSKWTATSTTGQTLNLEYKRNGSRMIISEGEGDSIAVHATLLGLSDKVGNIVDAYEVDTDIRNTIFNHNLRLVAAEARRHLREGLSIMDLIMAGNDGLMKAIVRFNPELINPETGRPYKFSTYATHWIKQAIERQILNEGDTIRAPVHFQEQTRRIGKAAGTLTGRLGRRPTDEEIAAEAGVNLDRYHELMAHKRATDVLEADKPFDEEGERSIADTAGTPDDSDRAAMRYEFRRLLDLAYDAARLSDREREVMNRRFGVEQASETLEEVGESFEVTRERIRQIEARALKKLNRKKGTKELRALEDFLTDQ